MTLSTKDILQIVSTAEVNDFIRLHARRHSKFALLLKARFAYHLPHEDSTEKYRELLLPAMKKMHNQRKNVSVQGLYYVREMLNMLFENFDICLTNQNYVEGWALVRAINIELFPQIGKIHAHVSKPNLSLRPLWNFLLSMVSAQVSPRLKSEAKSLISDTIREGWLDDTVLFREFSQSVIRVMYEAKDQIDLISVLMDKWSLGDMDKANSKLLIDLAKRNISNLPLDLAISHKAWLKLAIASKSDGHSDLSFDILEYLEDHASPDGQIDVLQLYLQFEDSRYDALRSRSAAKLFILISRIDDLRHIQYDLLESPIKGKFDRHLKKVTADTKDDLDAQIQIHLFKRDVSRIFDLLNAKGGLKEINKYGVDLFDIDTTQTKDLYRSLTTRFLHSHYGEPSARTMQKVVWRLHQFGQHEFAMDLRHFMQRSFPDRFSLRAII